MRNMTDSRMGIRLTAITALAAVGALLLASCSSEPEATVSPSPSSVASSAAPIPSPSEVVAVVDAAGLACDDYFELDLLNSAYAGGAVKNGNMTEAQVRADFRRLLKDMVVQADAALAAGVADEKLAINSLKMKRLIRTLDKGAPLSDLSKADQAKFAKQSLRVQKACDRAGYPLPDDNATARTAAGL